MNYILFISGGEIVLVMLLALLFFGSKAIADIAKTMGKGMREFKKATNQFNYKNGRKSVLGYIVALANEEGGMLILGVAENDKVPHKITGSIAWEDQEGKLEEDIYRDLQIRIRTEVVLEKSKRVLIIHIPTRPVGKTLKFEDVPLMRVGEELRPMSDEMLLKILQDLQIIYLE